MLIVSYKILLRYQTREFLHAARSVVARDGQLSAAKGINLLVEEGILYKKRGIGMFVAPGAQAKLFQKRKQQFYDKYVLEMLREAEKMQISREEIIAMLENGSLDNGKGEQ